MSIASKLHTLFRSRVRENAELLIDANAIRIFEQELVDSHDSITQAKHQLTLLMSERLRLERGNHELTTQIQQREEQTINALNKGEDALATNLAEDIVDIEQALAQQTAVLTPLLERETKLKDSVQRRIKRMQEFQRELNVVKAIQSAHNVMRYSDSTGGKAITHVDLQASLNRIHDLQQQVDDQHQASEELTAHLNSNGLDQQLKDAGIHSKEDKINAVLARIQA